MELHPERRNLEQMFHGVGTRYRVPSYQRNYSWSLDNFEELWNDIVASWDKKQDYFMGAVVLNAEPLESEGCLDIVDGQQRLATFTILFSVVRDISHSFPSAKDHPAFSKSHLLDTEGQLSAAKRTSEFAYNLIRHLSEPDNFYMQLNAKDEPLFASIVRTPGEPILDQSKWAILKSHHRLEKARRYFSKRIVTEVLTRAEGLKALYGFLAHCVTKLKFLELRVKTDTDAYQLFETLNYRGLDLSIADLVKNRMLMACSGNSYKKQSILSKWDAMIDTLSKSRYTPQDFIRFYWCAFHANITKNQLYDQVKKYVSEEDTDVEILMDQMADSAEIFASWTDTDHRYPVLRYPAAPSNQALLEINTLRYSVCYPLFLRVWRERSGLMTILAPRALSFLFRLISIGGLAAGQAESVFNRAMEALKSGKGDDEIVSILSHPEASNEKFEDRIRTMRFEDNNIARYLLGKVHDFQAGPGHALTTEVHLEHILPVDYRQWQFDPGTHDIEEYVYAIGNLTLLESKMNSRLSNKDFQHKVHRYQRRADHTQSDESTAIPMSYQIHEEFKAGKADWTASRIEDRSKDLAKLAVKVWPLPQS